MVGDAVAQVLGHGRGVDDLARVHDALGVPGLLELAEGVVDLVAEHLAGPDAAHDAVAVLAAHGAAELLDQIGDGLANGHHLVDAVLVLQADEGADVQAAHRGVAVVAGGGAVVGDDLVKAADELAHDRRVDGGVLHEGDGLGVAAGAHEQAEAALAQVPDGGLAGAVQDVDAGIGEADVGLEAVHSGGQFGLRFAVKFDHEHCSGIALDEPGEPRRSHGLPGTVEDHLVDELDGGRLVAQHAGGGLAGVVDGAEVQHGQGGHGGPRHQVDLGFGNHAQGALGADHHAGQVHRAAATGVVQDELVQVVATDPTLDLRVGAVDLVLLLAGDAQDAPVDVALQTGSAQAGLKLCGGKFAEMGAGPIGQDDIQFLDVVQSLAVDDGVGAAGVVADAAAHARPVGGGGVGSVLQPVGTHLAGELIQDDAGLDAGPLLLGVHLQDVVQVLAEVHDDGVVDGLAGEAGAAGAGKHRDAFAGGEFHHGLHVGSRARNHHADRFHLVDAGVGAVEQAGMRIEADLAVHAAAQFVGDILAFAAANPAFHYRGHP